MKLCLYSGGDRHKNDKLNRELIKMFPSKREKITYIPSAGDEDRKYFKEFQNWYKFYGLTNFGFFSLEEKFDTKSIEKLLTSKVIYLSGGNTYHFLFWLRKRKFLNILRNFVKRGGVLIGLSAGSILMAPRINISGIPSCDHDENKVGLKNLKSLGLVSFEFFPHYSSSLRLDRELLEYSKTTPYPVFAMEEGSGMVIWEEKTTIIGPYKVFYKGGRVKFV